MKAFRYVTGPDEADYSYRVTELLNRGWEMAGPATLAFGSTRNRVICGQTLVTDVPEIDYSDAVDLNAI